MNATITPRRVVVDTDQGHVLIAEPPDTAKRLGYEPDVVFIRDDGWSLGAVWEDALAAERMWQESWVDEVILDEGFAFVVAVDYAEGGYLYLADDHSQGIGVNETMFPQFAARFRSSSDAVRAILDIEDVRARDHAFIAIARFWR